MSITITAGIIASPGIKMGKAYVIQGNKLNIPQFTLREDELELELARFGRAIEKTKREIMEIQQQIARSLSDEMSDIFMSHLMVLEDPVVVQRAREKIIKERKNAEWAINDISIELIKSLDKIEDEYMRERIIDISDINKRVISNLQNSQTSSLADITDEVIVFAPDLTPSETAMRSASSTSIRESSVSWSWSSPSSPPFRPRPLTGRRSLSTAISKSLKRCR
jgi:phosphotransferase system enzyme I (PtsI)